MFFNHKKFIILIEQLGITPNQFFILYCAYKKDVEALKKVMEGANALFSQEEVFQLAEKGYINKASLPRKGVITFLDIHIEEEIAKKLFVDMDEAWDELYAAYPKFTIINGTKVILTKGGTVNNKYIGNEEMRVLYMEKINFDMFEHVKIIEVVKLAREMGVINFTLRDFILNNMWNDLYELEPIKQHSKNKRV